MADETKIFLERLTELSRKAAGCGMHLTAGQVKEAFDGLSLDPGQMQQVYAYLDQAGIEVADPDLEEEPSGGRRRQALEIYLEELDRFTQLPEEMELRLFHRAAEGDAQARQTLVERYLQTVCGVAGEYEDRDPKIDPEDLVQEANVGLLLAAEHIEKQETLAAYRACLLNAVTEYLEESVRTMSESLKSDERIVSRMNRLAQAVRTLEEELEHKPSLEELSAYLEIPSAELRDMLRMGGEDLKVEDI